MSIVRAPLTQPAAKRPRKRLSQSVRNHISAYLYISPFFILFGVFGVYPILFTAWVSLHKWNILGNKEFIGLQNYQFLMEDPYFWKALFNTFSIWFISTIPQLIAALALAFLLNQTFLKGKDFFRVAVFVPNITSIVAVAVIFGAIFGQHYGLLNYLLTVFGFEPFDFKNSVIGTHIAISAMVMWRWTGYNAIIYLAGLQSIPNDLYEAATIDGASKMQQFLFITIPMLRPVIIFTVILSTIGGMQIFTEPVIFSGAGGGSQGQGLTFTQLIYEEAFTRQSFGYASAVAWILFFIIVAFSAINLFLTKKLQSAE
jgi:cellobiose transport system permease protein